MVKAKLMGPWDVYPEGWQKLKGVEFQVLREGLPISEKNRPICPYCGPVPVKEVQRVLDAYRPARRLYRIQKANERNEKLAEIYNKVRKGKISALEAFREEAGILKVYNVGKEKEGEESEYPIGSTSERILVQCAKCRYPLGSFELKAAVKTPYPARPDLDEWISAPRTEKEIRLITEEFHLAELSIEDWLVGKDRKPLLGKLEAFSKELSDVQFVRETAKAVSNLKAAVHSAKEEVRKEMETRKSRLFNLLANA